MSVVRYDAVLRRARRMLKPPKLVALALANKMARTAWALLTKKEFYQAPVIAPAAD